MWIFRNQSNHRERLTTSNLRERSKIKSINTDQMGSLAGNPPIGFYQYQVGLLPGLFPTESDFYEVRSIPIRIPNLVGPLPD